MHFSIAFLTASVAVSSIGVRASNSLSRDEFDSIVKTVATSDFGLATVNSAIDNQFETQWNINAQQPDETAPYLLCETTPGLSGYERAVRIETLCGRTGFGQHVVQNLPERTCFNDQLIPYIALSCAYRDENVSVVPYSSWHKISAVSFVSSLDESSGVVEAVRYAGYFCGDRPADVDRHHDVAHRALERIFEGNDCVGSLVTAEFTFAELLRLTAEESRLVLHQTEGTPSLPLGCVVSLVESLASHPFVCSVEYDPPITNFNHRARWIIQGSVSGDGDSIDLPLYEVGISGENQVAQISDTGLSVNSCYFFDKEGEVVRDRSATVDTARRKVIQYYAKKSSEDEGGHGTHCAGTILGKACPYGDAGCSTLSNRDGVAPAAKIAVYDVANSGKYLSPDFSNPMFVHGRTAGATVHSASWGNGANSYSYRDLDYDRFQHQHDDFLVVFAAGNGGRNNRKNTSSGVAKNNLNVCASTNKGRGMGELYTAYFSSMGPSSDGRIKPDICAPGHAISSAGKGLGRQCNSVLKSGTSMACPGVAGAALLVRQYFVDGFSPSGTRVPEDGFEPSGALVKAIILNSGRVMLGRDNGGSGQSVYPSTEFDESQGFGLISLVDGLYIKDKSKGQVRVWDREPLTSGQVWQKSFTLGTCEAAHTSITLTYFDKENSSTSCYPCLVNRLDLTVEKDGVTYYPNGRTGADVVNNSQRVRLPHAAKDVLTVKVRAANLATADQKFALVISGCLDTDVGVTKPTAGPTAPPTSSPTYAPTLLPTFLTASPTGFPTLLPTFLTSSPTEFPTLTPTKSPTSSPTRSPTLLPTKSPTSPPTKSPTLLPTKSPTSPPTESPTLFLTKSPTLLPTKSSTTLPTKSLTALPTESPILLPTESRKKTKSPTASPTESPTTSTTAECEDQDDGKKMIADGRLVGLCEWAAANPDDRCEEACPCGEDVRRRIHEICPQTCGTCSTATPSTVPSLAPTPVPSAAPTVCEDEECVAVGYKNALVPLCDYVAADISGRCDLSYEGLGLVRDSCRHTCYVCRSKPPCEDTESDKQVFVPASGGKISICAWAGAFPSARCLEKCPCGKEEECYGKLVSDICEQTCGNCPL